MLDTRERLARHLYGSALDLDPGGEIAIRFGHPAGCTWDVNADRLRVSSGDGGVIELSLDGTLQQLAARLTVAGFVVRYVNPDFLHLSSGALLHGSGSDSTSAGDQLRVFRSDLWAMLDAYGVVVDQAERDVVEAIAQLYIGTADEDILDYWGEYFGVPRLEAEADDPYRTRIIVEVLRPKSNKVALENAASAIVGDRVEIEEPWMDLFRLSESRLDAQHTYDGNLWSPYVFRPIYRGNNNIDWTRVIAVLNKLRPAGVLMLDPEWRPPARGVDVSDHSWGLVGSDVRSHTSRYADRMRLDDYHFGDPVIFNYRMVWFDLFTKTNKSGVSEPALPLASRLSFVRSQIVLSESATLGDLRCRTAMGVYYSTERQIIDGLKLSNYDPGWVAVGVEDVSWPNSASGVDAGAVLGFGATKSEQFLLALRYTDPVIPGESGSAVIQDRRLVVAEEVVTAESFKAGVNSDAGSLLRGWQGAWDGETWENAGIVSGICISVTTEIL